MATVPAQSFPMQPKRAWHALAPGIAMLGAGVEQLRRDHTGVLAWTCVGCGLVCVLWFGKLWWRQAPMVWFDDAGLRARVPGFGPLPWSSIEKVRFVRVNGKAFLVIDRTPAARQQQPASMVARSIARSAEAKDLAVPIDGLAARPDQVFAVVELAHRAANGSV